jgi:hypothetical protein
MVPIVIPLPHRLGAAQRQASAAAAHDHTSRRRLQAMLDSRSTEPPSQENVHQRTGDEHMVVGQFGH